MTLLQRLYAKIAQGPADQCWPWTGGTSRGSRREVHYGVLREGRPHSPKIWRVPRLLLLLQEIPDDFMDDATLIRWLRLRDAFHDTHEAAHQCDHSLCSNPAHLAWETHPKNVREQATRRRTLGVSATVLILLLLLPLTLGAQALLPPPPPAPVPPVGMAPAAFKFALIGAAANVATTEIAFAHFGVYDQLVRERLRTAAITLGAPLAMRWLLRKSPRDEANAAAISLGGWSIGYATWHVVVTVQLSRK